MIDMCMHFMYSLTAGIAVGLCMNLIEFTGYDIGHHIFFRF